MFEKRWAAVLPQSFTSNGTTDGVLTVADSSLFKVKQQVNIIADTLSNLNLEIKSIPDKNTICVGPVSGNINARSDISAYTTALFAAITANEQKRSSVPQEEVFRAVYEEEPTTALRNVIVDKHGNKIDTDNPFPVRLSDGSVNIGSVNAELEVQLSHVDNYPDAGDVADSVRIGDGVDELAINADGSVNIGSSALPDGAATAALQEQSLAKLDHIGSGSALNAVLFEGDLSDYKSIAFDLIASTSPAFVGSVTVYARNDASGPWKAIVVQPENSVNANIQTSINQTQFSYNFSTGRTFKYYKFEISAYTAGTATLHLHCSQSEVELPRPQVVGVQGNVFTIGGATSLGLYTGSAVDAVVTPVVSFQNYSQISMQIYGGFEATIVFEGRENASAPWQPVQVINAQTNMRVWEANYNGLFIYTGELTYFQARIRTYTSGTVSCRTLANQNNYSRTPANPIDHVAANLKTLEMLNITLDNFVISNTDEVLYTSDGSLVRYE